MSTSSTAAWRFPSLLLVLLWLPCAPARAQDVVEFRAHYQEAVKLLRDRSFAAALVEFQRAHAIARAPRVVLGMAQAELGLGHPKEALALFRRYEAEEPARAPDAEEKLQKGKAEAERLLGPATGSTAAPPLRPEPPQAEAPRPLALLPTAPRARAGAVPMPTPLYRRWWLWVGVGTVAAGIAIGVAVGVAGRPPACLGAVSPDRCLHVRFP